MTKYNKTQVPSWVGPIKWYPLSLLGHIIKSSPAHIKFWSQNNAPYLIIISYSIFFFIFSPSTIMSLILTIKNSFLSYLLAKKFSWKIYDFGISILTIWEHNFIYLFVFIFVATAARSPSSTTSIGPLFSLNALSLIIMGIVLEPYLFHRTTFHCLTWIKNLKYRILCVKRFVLFVFRNIRS